MGMGRVRGRGLGPDGFGTPKEVLAQSMRVHRAPVNDSVFRRIGDHMYDPRSQGHDCVGLQDVHEGEFIVSGASSCISCMTACLSMSAVRSDIHFLGKTV